MTAVRIRAVVARVRRSVPKRAALRRRLFASKGRFLAKLTAVVAALKGPVMVEYRETPDGPRLGHLETPAETATKLLDLHTWCCDPARCYLDLLAESAALFTPARVRRAGPDALAFLQELLRDRKRRRLYQLVAF